MCKMENLTNFAVADKSRDSQSWSHAVLVHPKWFSRIQWRSQAEVLWVYSQADISAGSVLHLVNRYLRGLFKLTELSAGAKAVAVFLSVLTSQRRRCLRWTKIDGPKVLKNETNRRRKDWKIWKSLSFFGVTNRSFCGRTFRKFSTTE